MSCKNNRELQIGFLTKHSIVQILEPRFLSRPCRPSVEYTSPQQRIQQPTSRSSDHAQLSVKLKWLPRKIFSTNYFCSIFRFAEKQDQRSLSSFFDTKTYSDLSVKTLNLLLDSLKVAFKMLFKDLGHSFFPYWPPCRKKKTLFPSLRRFWEEFVKDSR